ncbi:MAG: response regulator [Thioalkalispiraceae bacterium]|jgi:DNA-binding response OmpR family regulator
MRVLLVEDDPILGDGIKTGLSQDNYNVDWLTDGGKASQVLQTDQYDLVLLDLNLPVKSGLDVLKEMRTEKNTTPVLILTARDAIEDRVKGLDMGADDYLSKPFDLDELLARVRALLRRSKGRTTPTLTHGDLELNPVEHSVTLSGKPVDLSPVEFNLLQLLLENRGRVFPRVQLEDNLYGWNKDVDSNTIEVHIHHLRKKLGSDLIRTVRGVGYVIDKP